MPDFPTPQLEKEKSLTFQPSKAIALENTDGKGHKNEENGNQHQENANEDALDPRNSDDNKR